MAQKTITDAPRSWYDATVWRTPLSVVAVALSFALILMTAIHVLHQRGLTQALQSFEHWAADWRMALFGDRRTDPHPGLAVVLIDEETIKGLPYRSPIDRGLLADLVSEIARANPRVIVLDVLFDQPTEAAKDARLLEVMRTASANIVLGSLDARIPVTDEQRAYNSRFLTEAGRPSGYLNLRTEFDGVVRNMAEADPSSPTALSLAEQAAQVAGFAASTTRSRRIAWLREPSGGEETFLTFRAWELLGNKMASGSTQSSTGRAAGILANKIVLIGTQLSDQRDHHLTPLSKTTSEPMPGVFINAHMVAQLIDVPSRNYRLLGPNIELTLCGIVSFVAFLLAWRLGRLGFLQGALPLSCFLVFDIISFQWRIVLPFAAIAISWVLGVAGGLCLHWFARWRGARAFVGGVQ